MAALLGLLIHFGVVPTAMGWVRRREQPVVFWSIIGVVGAVIFVLLFLAAMAALPWP